MKKKTIRDLDCRNKRVLMRVDFNVPIKNGQVDDDTRIRAALPSIRSILEQGGSLVLMSHLGRPKGKPAEAFSLRPVAQRLEQLVERPVQFAPDCIGEDTRAKALALQPGQILLLENLRFHPEEEGKPTLPDGADDAQKADAKAAMKTAQRTFARQLAELGELYVDDAFGTAHRAHASMAVVTDFFEQKAAGFLLEKEIEYLGNAVAHPERPFVAIIGGAKISGKIDVITNLLEKVDSLLIGGAMAYTFCRAQQIPTGNSLVEEDKIELAAAILEKAKAANVNLMLPRDHVVADAVQADATRKTVGPHGIEEGWFALDIGPETIEAYSQIIAEARTVVWNGPMGCFEMEPFAHGTFAIAKALANANCVSIIGGGDSVSAVNKAGLDDRMTHISTGGGASLEFLEGKALPGVEALSDK